MKTKSILIFLLFSIIISSCGKHFSLEKRHYRKGFYFSSQQAQKNPKMLMNSILTPKATIIKNTLSNNTVISVKCILFNEVLPNQNSTFKDIEPSTPTNKNIKSNIVDKTLFKQQRRPHGEKIKNQFSRLFKEKMESKKGFIIIMFDLLLILCGVLVGAFFVLLGFSAVSGHLTLFEIASLILIFVVGLSSIIGPIMKLIHDL